MRHKIITALLLAPLVLLSGIFVIGAVSAVALDSEPVEEQIVERPSRTKLELLIRQRENYIRQYDHLLGTQKKFVLTADYDGILTSSTISNTSDQIDLVGEQLRNLRRDIERVGDNYDEAFYEYARSRGGEHLEKAIQRRTNKFAMLSHHIGLINAHNPARQELRAEYRKRLQDYTTALRTVDTSDPKVNRVLNTEARNLDMMEIELDRLDEVVNRISDERYLIQ